MRFLPEYDNALLSHADRSRFVVGDERSIVGAGEIRIKGTVLHDGYVDATWRWDDDDLFVSPVPRLGPAALAEIAEEGARMLAFLGRAGEVRFALPERSSPR